MGRVKVGLQNIIDRLPEGGSFSFWGDEGAKDAYGIIKREDGRLLFMAPPDGGWVNIGDWDHGEWWVDKSTVFSEPDPEEDAYG